MTISRLFTALSQKGLIAPKPQVLFFFVRCKSLLGFKVMIFPLQMLVLLFLLVCQASEQQQSNFNTHMCSVAAFKSV